MAVTVIGNPDESIFKLFKPFAEAEGARPDRKTDGKKQAPDSPEGQDAEPQPLKRER